MVQTGRIRREQCRGRGRVTSVTAYQQQGPVPVAKERGLAPARGSGGASPRASTAPSPAVDAVPVLIKRLDQGLPLPARAHPGDAGVDLCTAVDVVLAPGERALVPTGMAIALPEGYAAFVHPRSGLAARHGVTIVNAPGTVDAGYRGEIKVTLLNTDRAEPVRFERGDRIAQLVVQPVACPQFHEVQTLPGSARGDGGFGSTGGHESMARQ